MRRLAILHQDDPHVDRAVKSGDDGLINHPPHLHDWHKTRRKPEDARRRLRVNGSMPKSIQPKNTIETTCKYGAKDVRGITSRWGK